jgi:cobalt-zinc-cadmium efflux system outer membrane protein
MALPQVLEVSLKNNSDLASFREEKGLRDAGKVRAGLLPNPTLDFEAGTGALTGNSAENSLALGVSQEFLLGGKREKRLAVAENELDMYRWQLVDRERVLREEVKAAFFDVVLIRRRVSLSDQAVVLNRQLLDVTIERLAAGDIPELEMNLVKVELARSESSRTDAERSLNQNMAKLTTLMGLAPGETPAILGEFETEIGTTKSLADLKRLAYGNRPDLKALAAEKSRGEADITLADADCIPNLTAGISLRRDSTSIDVGGIENKDTEYTIALKLSMPIPVFDRNQSGVMEAKARRSNSENRLVAATRNVERDVETAYANLLNTEKIISLYKSGVIPQLEENLKLTQEAYRLGEVGILAVIQEQKKFIEVSDSYLTAQYERQIALVKLESAVASEFNGGVQ